MNVGFPGVFSLYLLKSYQEQVRYSWSSRSGLLTGRNDEFSVYHDYVIDFAINSRRWALLYTLDSFCSETTFHVVSIHISGACLYSCSQSLQPPSDPSGAPE